MFGELFGDDEMSGSDDSVQVGQKAVMKPLNQGGFRRWYDSFYGSGALSRTTLCPNLDISYVRF